MGSAQVAVHYQLRHELVACKAAIAKCYVATAKAIAERDAVIAEQNAAAAKAIAERDAATELAAELGKEVQRGQAKSFQDCDKMNRMQNTIRAAMQ